MTLLMCHLLLSATVATPITPDADKPLVAAVLGYPWTPNDNSHRVRAEINNFTSKNVLRAAVGRSEVAALPVLQAQKDPVAWLEKNLKFQLDPQKHTVTITLDGIPRREQALLLNAVIDAQADEELYQGQQSYEEPYLQAWKELSGAVVTLARAKLELVKVAADLRNTANRQERRAAELTVARYRAICQSHWQTIERTGRTLSGKPPAIFLAPLRRAQP